MPKLGVLEQIEKDFGSYASFREKFIEAALTLFGSGWVWLVCESCFNSISASSSMCLEILKQ